METITMLVELFAMFLRRYFTKEYSVDKKKWNLLIDALTVGGSPLAYAQTSEKLHKVFPTKTQNSCARCRSFASAKNPSSDSNAAAAVDDNPSSALGRGLLVETMREWDFQSEPVHAPLRWMAG